VKLAEQGKSLSPGKAPAKEGKLDANAMKLLEEDRIFREEFERLAQEEPVGRVREDVLLEAVTERVRREYPHVLRSPDVGVGRRAR
jgi:hypothetical protein